MPVFCSFFSPCMAWTFAKAQAAPFAGAGLWETGARQCCWAARGEWWLKLPEMVNIHCIMVQHPLYENSNGC